MRETRGATVRQPYASIHSGCQHVSAASVFFEEQNQIISVQHQHLGLIKARAVAVRGPVSSIG